jgi:hypothetical protein
MTKRFSVLLKSAFTILFACSAIPAFAQHGGGGHGGGGGGFHGGGGGGFHGGGGGGSHGGGGGGFRGGSYAPPVAGYRGPRSAAPSGPRYGGGYAGRYAAGPGNSYSRQGGNSAGGNQRFGNSPSSPGSADGQWHSFGAPSGGRGSSGSQAEAGPAGNSGGFHVFSGNRGAGSAGAVRSFSGEGHEIYENAPRAQNVVPRSQSLSTLHNSFRGSPALSSGFRSNSTFSASSRFAGGSSFAGNRGFSGGVNTANSFREMGGGFRFGNRFNGFDRFNGFGRGCWNCGFGFGFGGWGWGFGWPWLGFGFWDPFWVDPWWGVGPAYGYGAGYYAYPQSDVYGYPDSENYAPNDNAAPPPQQENQYDQDNSNGNWVTPNGPSPSSAANAGNLNVPVLIYLKTGAVYTVRDYWIVDGELHIIQMNGAQNSVNLEQVDLPRTNSENAKSGVKFIYKSEPSITTPPPDGNSMPPAQPDSSQPSAVPRADSRT